MKKYIPLSIPNFEGNESKYVNEAISQAWVSTGGAYINRLEKQLAEFIGVESVSACQSGTSAIHLALIESNVLPGDMVIVPTLTFIAAVNPVKYQFAEPVFMDCDESLCIDPVKMKEFCELMCEFKDGVLIHKQTGRKVKAIIVVHVFGNIADMEAIMEIAEKYNIKVIEDATEALGTKYCEGKYSGKYAGTIGDFGAISFNGNKIITTGGGGAAISRCKETVDHMRYLSTQAKDDTHNYIHNEVGFNYRMTNVQAAIGVAQMEELKEFIQRKNNNYDLYRELFKDYNLGTILPFRKGIDSNKWFYSFKINTNLVNITLNEIIIKLKDRGIETRPIWGLIHQQLPYKDAISYKIESALHFSSSVLNIPCSTNITCDDIRYVVEQIKNVLEETN